MTPEIRAKALEAALSCTDEDEGMCALARIQSVVTPDSGVNLVTMGLKFGLTAGECYGVMDGWDIAYRGRGCFSHLANGGVGIELSYVTGCLTDIQHPVTAEEYAAGYSLGRQIWEELHPEMP